MKGRDAKGRFAAGNPGGPGNPFARKLAELRQALIKAVTPKDIQELAYGLLIRAQGGDLAAAKLLLQYVIGKPVEPADPDTLDHHEWEVTKTNSVSGDEVTGTIPTFEPRVASAIVRTMQPFISQQLAKKIREETPAESVATKPPAAVDEDLEAMLDAEAEAEIEDELDPREILRQDRLERLNRLRRRKGR